MLTMRSCANGLLSEAIGSDIDFIAIEADFTQSMIFEITKLTNGLPVTIPASERYHAFATQRSNVVP